MTTSDKPLIDKYGRTISYIRVSVTDRCDFRCQYCMPMNMRFLPRHEILSLEEILRVARVFTTLGVKKIRITGGEPLVRRGIVWLCEQIAALPGLREVVITTNGSQLEKTAALLAAAGVRRINISLDSLQPERFRELTRTGDLAQVLRGVEAARAAGFSGGVKINTVMMRGFNDDELPALAQFALSHDMDISFIEEMPMGDIGRWRGDTYYSADDAMPQLQKQFNLTASDYTSGGPARYWSVAGSDNRIGFITPHSHNFCDNCNRVRITATGELYPCLGQNDVSDLKPALRGELAGDEALKQRIMQVMQIKPKGHDFNVFEKDTKVVRFMSATGG